MDDLPHDRIVDLIRQSGQRLQLLECVYKSAYIGKILEPSDFSLQKPPIFKPTDIGPLRNIIKDNPNTSLED